MPAGLSYYDLVNWSCFVIGGILLGVSFVKHLPSSRRPIEGTAAILSIPAAFFVQWLSERTLPWVTAILAIVFLSVAVSFARSAWLHHQILKQISRNIPEHLARGPASQYRESNEALKRDINKIRLLPLIGWALSTAAVTIVVYLVLHFLEPST